MHPRSLRSPGQRGGRSLLPPSLSTPIAGHSSSSSGCAQHSPRASQASPGNGQKTAAKLTKRSCQHKAPKCLLNVHRYSFKPSKLRIFVAQTAVKTTAGKMSQVNVNHKPTPRQGSTRTAETGSSNPATRACTQLQRDPCTATRRAER